MGVAGISLWQLLIILLIVVLLFGTKRLKNIGSDLGEAIRGFRNSLANSDKDKEEAGSASHLTQGPGACPGDSQTRPVDSTTQRDRA
ncbi:twin-arginine translocase TatA/TatE family subunit [Caldichromatium japonicum]|uniref:Sec-independent protein translocase protein TatA n=1 Tax=Caldichromatium japonicum TaxID=2699430 RepID=A0A6G7VF74_9GAMM|nr:twin-arginine translocase TatA/TatE family subunit [Caldichromatium japonicum]QIK38671.1 twin-arginine translocase TatA/TatE family subunit [Caldichromatium japonicum]